MKWKVSLYLKTLFFLPVLNNFQCPGSGFYPSPSSCTIFYRCVGITSYQFLCPAGTRYDPVLTMCNHQDLVPCQPTTTPMDSQQPITTPMDSQQQTTNPSTILSTTMATGTSINAANSTPTTNPSTVTSDKPQTKPPRFEDRPPPSEPDTSKNEPSSSKPGASFDRPPPGKPDTTDDRPHLGKPDISEDKPPLTEPDIDEKPVTTEEKPPETHIDIPDETNPVFPPSNATTDSSEPLYSVSPTSIYPCKEPGYYEEVTSCQQFYVCREVGPGLLSADRIFKCPDRYLFDTKTHLCQREHKVTCQNKPSLFYTILNYLVVQLEEEQLEEFFKQSLTLPEPRARTGITQELSNIEHRLGPELPLLYSLHTYPHILLYH